MLTLPFKVKDSVTFHKFVEKHLYITRTFLSNRSLRVERVPEERAQKLQMSYAASGSEEFRSTATSFGEQFSKR